MLKLKNTQPGPRGVNAVSGPVLVDPGQTVEVEVYGREKEHIEATGWFEIKGSYSANPEASAAPVAAVDDAIKAKDAEIEALKKQLAEAQKGSGGTVLKAEHHGGGKFNVTEGETVHLSGLSKADADAFNAMSDEEKAAYVAKAKG
jgi:hypothetical protein